MKSALFVTASPMSKLTNVFHFQTVLATALFTSLSVLPPAAAAAESAPLVIHPAVDDAMLVNPGKGWVSYHANPAKVDAVELSYASIGYTRFEWGGIQPDAEDKYDWSAIDAFLDAWNATGRKAAFGVMSASTHSHRTYVTPKWVFDAGAQSTTVTIDASDPATGNPGTHTLPDFMDPVYLQKLEGFVRAFARRYDGDKRIAFIDIRSFRNWGEGYSETHVLLYAKYFHKTRLCQSCDGNEALKHAEFCASRGIAVRRDGIGGSNGSELVPAIGRVPAVYEFWGPLDYLEKRNWWRSGAMLTEAVEIGKPTYVEIIRGSPDFLKRYADLATRLGNRIGYHFILQQATIPAKIRPGTPFPIEWRWLNDGVAPLYEPCHPAVALLDQKDQVVQKQWLTGSTPGNWKPGEPTTETANATFQPVPPGTYKLAVGLFLDRDDANPAYRLGIQGRTAQGWYVISTSIIGDGK
jgi:hypothetical protein